MSHERPRRLGESPLIRLAGMLAGTYVSGHPIARFHDMEPGDEGLELDPRDMAGEFLSVRSV